MIGAHTAAAVQLRHALHRCPEVSGAEHETAQCLVAALKPLRCIVEINVGGFGIAATFGAAAIRPWVLLRAELDALPIAEDDASEPRSERPDTAHLCGHDGHAATLWLVARVLSETPPERPVTLLWQPAEETGTGAREVIADERFAGRRFERVLAWHNLPGVAFGKIVTRASTVCCGSVGLDATFVGQAAHAAYPESGVNLHAIVEKWIAALPGNQLDSIGVMSTLTHVRLGAPNWGSTPAEGRACATLRALDDTLLQKKLRMLADGCNALALHDEFAATINDPGLTADVMNIAQGLGHATETLAKPFRWSEDFGRFAALGPLCFFGIGAGDGPPLHDAHYRFNDELIPHAAELLLQLTR